MRILVTGAGGFVGAACAAAAHRAGHQVIALVRPGSDTGRLSPGTAAIVAVDLADTAAVRLAMRQQQPQIIVHAAWHGVSAAARRDRRQIADNIAMSVCLLEAALDSGLTKFVGIGSQAEYGLLDGKVSERDIAEPTSLYGASKLAVQVLTRQLCRDANVDFAWLRLFSTYGPGDNPNWLIPSLIQGMLKGERPRTTTGRQLADYLLIDDVAAAVLAVCDKPEATGLFNLGSGRPVAVRAIIEAVRDLVAPDLELLFGEVPHPLNQVWHMEADISRLSALAGFAPQVSLSEGLRRTVDWHRATGGGVVQ